MTLFQSNNLNDLGIKYSNAHPFPHISIDDFFIPDELSVIADEISSHTIWEGIKEFEGAKAKRWQSQWESIPKATRQLLTELNRPNFINFLESVTGEKNLIPDPYLEGGGIHSTGKNGFLKLHTDFNWHKKLKLFRRINVLIYLNKHWDDNWEGHLELATQEGSSKSLRIEKRIAPIFNRLVIFTTNEKSFHGHSEPLKTPDGIFRNSLALYYYTSEIRHKKRENTNYREIDGDPLIPEGKSKLSKVWRKLKYRFFD